MLDLRNDMPSGESLRKARAIIEASPDIDHSKRELSQELMNTRFGIESY